MFLFREFINHIRFVIGVILCVYDYYYITSILKYMFYDVLRARFVDFFT